MLLMLRVHNGPVQQQVIIDTLGALKVINWLLHLCKLSCFFVV